MSATDKTASRKLITPGAGAGPIVSRRSFLALFGAAVAAKIVVPAFTPPRPPYVVAGKTASYIGLNGYPRPCFIGSTTVREIHPWDGLGYPCSIVDHSGRELMPWRFYDFDLSDFLVDLPERFWHDPARVTRYPNVHAYVRETRFGEDPQTMWARITSASASA